MVKINFETTSILLKAIQPYVENSDADVKYKTENKDGCNGNRRSDFVNIDAKGNVGFEVLKNEIIVFYFNYCRCFKRHFKNRFKNSSSAPKNGEYNYIEQAISFLKALFECKIRCVEYYKGKLLFSVKYFLMYNDGRNEECIGRTEFGFVRRINPFGKKTMDSTIWQFEKLKGMFTARQPKKADINAVETVDINEDCYIEIFYNRNLYTYVIMEINFDDEFGMYYWVPAENVLPTGMYDTKENAISAAKETLKNRTKHNNV